jgi:hypothetical protein
LAGPAITAFRAGIELVVIDPSAPYACGIRAALPHARITVDHWHMVRLANDMLTEVRQRVARERHGRRGIKADTGWAHRGMLLTAGDRLSARYRVFQPISGIGSPSLSPRSVTTAGSRAPQKRTCRAGLTPGAVHRARPHYHAPGNATAAWLPRETAHGCLHGLTEGKIQAVVKRAPISNQTHQDARSPEL